MRILILSDISIYHLELTEEEKFLRAFYDISGAKPESQYDHILEKEIWLVKPPDERIFYWTFTDYQFLIERIKPDLILIAGDIFHPDQNEKDLEEIVRLFGYIDSKSIQCFLVEGNWEHESYAQIMDRISNFEFVKDISNKDIDYNGLRILGINFEHANRIGICKKYKNIFPNKYDIVLTHAPQNRRIWLFDLNTEFIITGHSGIDLGKIKNKIFLANDYSPEFYFIIDYFSKHNQIINCFRDNEVYSEVEVNKKKFTWKRKMKPYNIFGNQYTIKDFKEVIQLKKKLEKLESNEQNKFISDLIAKGYNISWVREYLGRHYFKDKKNYECEICGLKFHRPVGLHNHKKIVHKI